MAKPQRESRNPGVPFDPLQYVKRLEAVGFTRAQAEEQAETFLAIVQEQLVNKQDLKELESKTTLECESIRRDIRELESKTLLEFESIRRDIKELEVKSTQQIKELESKTLVEFESVRRDIKELETKTTTKIEMMKKDLKIWFGSMLVGLIVVMSGIITLIVHLGRH